MWKHPPSTYIIICISQEYIGERNLVKERHGLGWTYLPNGDVYQGHYRRGQRHGTGLYVFKNGARYKGAYRCGLRRGFGTMHFPDGSCYSGEWRRDLMHGHGLYTYANGDTYDGSWFRGQRHGVGTYTYAAAEATNCVFHGTWLAGVRNGPVEIVFDKHRFHGWWTEEDAVGPAAYSFQCRTMALGYVRMEAAGDEKLKAVAVPMEDDAAAVVEAAGAGGDAATANKRDAASFDAVLRNVPGAARTCEPAWKVQHIDRYEYSRLPPEPMPLPMGDSEDEECDVTPVMSDDEAILFAPDGEEEEEAGVEDEVDEGEEEETKEKE